jgi:hypothetical protein
VKSGWLGLAIERWGTFRLACIWKQKDGTPVDLTGCTATLTVWRQAGDTVPLLDVPGTVDGPAGRIEFARSLAQVAAITAKSGIHAIRVSHPNGDVSALLSGPVDFLQPGQSAPRRAAGAYYPAGATGGGAQVVVVSAAEVQVVAVGMQGPAGVSGSSSGASYTHSQSSASASWTVAHNLGFRPVVAVYTTGGVEMEADVRHQSANVLTINFASAQSGYARCV